MSWSCHMLMGVQRRKTHGESQCCWLTLYLVSTTCASENQNAAWNGYHCRSVVIPSTRYLDRIDPQCDRSIDNIRNEIRPSQHLFEDLLANPKEVETDNPDMTIEEIIELYESFYMLESIQEKWVGGDRGSACEAYISAALCGHSLLWHFSMSWHLNFHPNILQRSWSFEENRAGGLVFGNWKMRMTRKMRRVPSCIGALLLHVMT